MRHRHLVLTLLAAGAVGGLVVGGTAASAASTTATDAAPRARQHGGAQQAARRPPAPPFVRPAARYLHMREAAVMTQLRRGRTLAALATAHHRTASGVERAIVADAKRHLAADVRAGRLDQAAADQRLAELQAKVGDIVNNPLPAQGAGQGGGCQHPPAGGPDGGAGDGTGTGTGTGGGTGGGGYGGGTGTGGSTSGTGTGGGGYL